MFTFLKKLLSTPKPNAALAWQQLGHDTQQAYWLYAVPVHLVLQRDTFSLAAPVPLPLSDDEADALTKTLNHHFAADNMQFFWLEQRWFLRLATNPNIHTMPPNAAINQDINAFLPSGAGAMQWARVNNEIQMLLFAHPVNQAREAKRQPAMNSIWCYGGGQS